MRRKRFVRGEITWGTIDVDVEVVGPRAASRRMVVVGHVVNHFDTHPAIVGHYDWWHHWKFKGGIQYKCRGRRVIQQLRSQSLRGMFSVSSVSFSSSISEMDAWSWLPLLRSELIVTIGRRGSNSFSLSEATAALNCGGLFFRRYNFDLSVLEYWFVPWLGEKVFLVYRMAHFRAFSPYLIILGGGLMETSRAWRWGGCDKLKANSKMVITRKAQANQKFNAKKLWR